MKRYVALVFLAFALSSLLLAAVQRPVHAESFQIRMKSYAFGPTSLKIPAGSTVTWTNYDQAPHNVVTTSGPESLSGPLLQRGKSWSFTFRAPGTYSYYCSVHPDMRAQIVVTPVAVPSSTRSSPAPSSAMPSMSGGASSAPSAAPAAVLPIITPTAAPAPQADNQATGTRQASISPLLPLAGMVGAVSVFCFLLLTSPAAPTPGPSTGEGDQ